MRGERSERRGVRGGDEVSRVTVTEVQVQVQVQVEGGGWSGARVELASR